MAELYLKDDHAQTIHETFTTNVRIFADGDVGIETSYDHGKSVLLVMEPGEAMILAAKLVNTIAHNVGIPANSKGGS